MKHPYEFGGILFVIAIITGIFAGVMYDEFAGGIDDNIHDYMQTNHSGTGGTGSTAPAPIWDYKYKEYYKENIDTQLDCKKTSKSLQEFYDCVNNP